MTAVGIPVCYWHRSQSGVESVRLWSAAIHRRFFWRGGYRYTMTLDTKSGDESPHSQMPRSGDTLTRQVARLSNSGLAAAMSSSANPNV